MRIPTIWILFFLVVMPFRPAARAENWGGALQFDGSDDYAFIPVFSSATSGNAPYTMEAWIHVLEWRYYYNGVNWYNGFFISRGSEGALTGNHICMINDHHIGLTHWGRDTDTQFPIQLDRWYHISAAWDGSKESLYVNGHEVWSAAFSPLSVGGGTLTFGKHDNVAGYWVCAQMDEVRIWNYARSEEQIRDHCLVKIDPNTPGLVGYWNFDEPGGQAILDSSPSGNHGTLGPTNAPESSDPKRVCSTLPLAGDFVSDYTVDIQDLASFSCLWLTDSCICPDNCTVADLNNDGLINLPDFSVFARHWMDSFVLFP